LSKNAAPFRVPRFWHSLMFPLTLSPAQWRERARNHEARLAEILDAHLARRRQGLKHPVWDFLFEYYSFKPGRLRQWTPGYGVLLEKGEEFLRWPAMSLQPGGVSLAPHAFPRHRREALQAACRLLRATAQRAPLYGCFGLHEWAMVYRAGEVRHDVPLRLSPSEVAAVVEAHALRCTHYDAFRFFTPRAVPLNAQPLTAEGRAGVEQPGCVHANMDLYKWATKFWPWICGELVAEAFLLARDARCLDMRAAPYDLSAYGFAPICIETPAGRRQYQEAQRALSERARPLRERLLQALEGLFQELVDVD
jgi:hypothetical protein